MSFLRLVLGRAPMKFTGMDITYLRLHAGLTKKELAKILGVDRATIRNWENDLGAPSLNQFFTLCRCCRVNVVSYLMRLRARGFDTKPIDLERL